MPFRDGIKGDSEQIVFCDDLPNVQAIVDAGMADAADLKLVRFAESAQDIWSALVEAGIKDDPTPALAKAGPATV